MRSSPRLALVPLCALLLSVILLAQSPAQARQDDAASSFDRLLELAEARTQAQDWQSAAQLWAQVVEKNPHVAGWWYWLGLSHLNLEDHRQAIPALERALALGAGRPYNLAFRIARCHALLGESDAALDALEQSVRLGYRSREAIAREEAFAALREDERFRQLAGIVDTSTMTREQGWRHDLEFLVDEVKRMHYHPFDKVTQEEFEAEAQRLAGRVAEMNDNEMIVGVMRLMSLIGDGHTNCFPEHVPGWTQTLPLRFDQFSEGLYVVSAHPAHKELVGARVVRIGEHTPEAVFAALSGIISRDNEQGIMRSFGWYLRYPQVLAGLGLQSESDRVDLTLRGEDGRERTVTIAAEEMDRDFNRLTSHPEWIEAYDAPYGPTPLYLRNRRASYWFEPLPDGKTLYFQFNVVTNDSLEPLEQFCSRMLKQIDDSNIERLVIDLRWNNGGNSLLLPPLIQGLIRNERINRPGHLYVLIGRYTFSAGMNAATYLERHTEAIFVGEQTPSSPNFAGESNHVFLPYSRVPVSIPDLYWQSSWPNDNRTWIAPEIYVPPSFEAFRTKRDPALEAVLRREVPGS